jgi:hypothetical protein
VESEFLVKSLPLSGWLVLVDNLPSLVGIWVSSAKANKSSFVILRASDVQASFWISNVTVLFDFIVIDVLNDVTEVLALILEELPPSWVGAPDSHVGWSSIAGNVERLIVVSTLDSQWSLVEVPCLCSLGVRCLDGKVSAVDQFKISVVWQLGDNEEVSLNIETEVLVELSSGWFSLPFINIDDVPVLVDSFMVWQSLDVVVFPITSIVDI